MKQEIESFLVEKRIGFVGVSRNKSKFGNTVYKKLKESGYEVHPVHPEMESMDGDKCVPDIRQLPGEVQSLIITASRDVCIKTLRDISGNNINRIWIFPGKTGQADVDSEIQRLRSAGVNVIYGLCPFLFIEPVTSIHSIHRFFTRVFGRYPK